MKPGVKSVNAFFVPSPLFLWHISFVFRLERIVPSPPFVSTAESQYSIELTLIAHEKSETPRFS